jgi:hypothetical protein
MRGRDYSGITFTNQNFNFQFYYQSMQECLTKLSTQKNIYKANKVLNSFMTPFFYAVTNNELRVELEKRTRQLHSELTNDKEIKKLESLAEQDIDITKKYLEKYYFYFHKMLLLLGDFLSSLGESFMPNTYASSRKMRYANNQFFFICYAEVKKTMSENLSSFSVNNLITPLNSIMLFYYGYRLYTTEGVRIKVEKGIDLLIEFVSGKEFLDLATKSYKSSSDIIEINVLKDRMYQLVLDIYSKLNYEHSIFNLNPKIEVKVYIDKTGI